MSCLSIHYLLSILYFHFQGLKLGVVRFRFDGNPINETDTPSGVRIELNVL